MPLLRLQWQDACYDVTWSEASDSVLVVATGNGTIIVWDTLQLQVRFSLTSAHICFRRFYNSRNVYSKVTLQKCPVCSGIYPDSMLMWSLLRGITLSDWCIRSTLEIMFVASPIVGCTTTILYLCSGWTLRDRVSCLLVTSATKHSGICLAYVDNYINSSVIVLGDTGDQMLYLWDLAKPAHPVSQINAHQSEILACDWSKYEEVCTQVEKACSVYYVTIFSVQIIDWCSWWLYKVMKDNVMMCI